MGVGGVFAPQGPRQRRPPPCAATRRMRQAPIVKRLSTRPVPHGDPGLGQRRSIAEAESKRGRGRCFGGCFWGEPGLGAGRTGPYGAVREPGLGGPPPRGRPWRPALSLASMRTTSLRRPGWAPDGPQIVASGRSCQSGNYCWPPRIVASARTEATSNTSQNSQAGPPTPNKNKKLRILFF